MNRETLIEVKNLHKAYKIYATPKQRLIEWLSGGKLKRHTPYQALSHVNFNVQRGEFIGIIGRNGAGKTTLLRVITELILPTSGEVASKGKILSLFNLGSSLNSELSGRENITHSAVLLGFPGAYVERRLLEIEEFADLGDFFDRPIALYSSGMRMRLAFSLFTFLESDVLILDEVLSVGDIFFQQKCYKRLNALIQKGTTIILVTHNMSTVKEYCNRVLLLEQGEILFEGSPQKAIRKYAEIQGRSKSIFTNPKFEIPDQKKHSSSDDSLHYWPAQNEISYHPAKRTQYIELRNWTLLDQYHRPCIQFPQGDEAHFFFEFLILDKIGLPVPELHITDQYGKLIHGKNSLHHDITEPSMLMKEQIVRFSLSIRLALACGQYIIGLQVFTLLPQDFAIGGSNRNVVDKLHPLWNDPNMGWVEITPQN